MPRTHLLSLGKAGNVCLVILLVGLLVTSGCGQKPEPSTITFAVGGAPAELDFWQVLVEEFQQDSGITVDLLRQPTAPLRPNRPAHVLCRRKP